MSKIEKLIAKFLKAPKDLTWKELVKVLNHKGYSEKPSKGKTGESRIKFINLENDIINLQKPQPRTIVKQYVIRQILDTLVF